MFTIVPSSTTIICAPAITSRMSAGWAVRRAGRPAGDERFVASADWAPDRVSVTGTPGWSRSVWIRERSLLRYVKPLALENASVHYAVRRRQANLPPPNSLSGGSDVMTTVEDAPGLTA